MKRNIKERFQKFLLSVVFIIVAFIPTYLYLLAHAFIGPDNALANILLLGVALYFMGAIQLILIIVAISAIIVVYNA